MYTSKVVLALHFIKCLLALNSTWLLKSWKGSWSFIIRWGRHLTSSRSCSLNYCFNKATSTPPVGRRWWRQPVMQSAPSRHPVFTIRQRARLRWWTRWSRRGTCVVPTGSPLARRTHARRWTSSPRRSAILEWCGHISEGSGECSRRRSGAPAHAGRDWSKTR